MTHTFISLLLLLFHSYFFKETMGEEVTQDESSALKFEMMPGYRWKYGFQRLQRDDPYCNVHVRVDGKVFKCHRVFSKYLDTMLGESAEKEVTLPGIKAKVFEAMLEWLYSEEVLVYSADVRRDIVRSAVSYTSPFVVEFCLEYVKRNLDFLAEDILKIYSLADHMRCTQMVELLSRYIYHEFRYFFRRPEYLELKENCIMKVLDHTENFPPVAHDVYLEGIHIWINHQEFSTPTERKECFNKLTERIDFAKLSVEYSGCKLKRCMRELVLSQCMDRDDDDDTTTWDGQMRLRRRPLEEEFMHAYVSRKITKGGSSMGVGTSIFSAYLSGHITPSSDRFTWVYSGELGYHVDFMRNVHFEDRLYSLRYSEERNPKQTFRCGSSILMYPSLTLKPPPCILDKFDMCGALNSIYVYNKRKIPPVNKKKVPPSVNEEELRHGMYVYKRDIDRWFPIPRPETHFACMTCNDEGMVYLFGGGGQLNRSVQFYDPRLGIWFAFPPTNDAYRGGACCSHMDELYVAGGILNRGSVETYRYGYWIPLKELPTPKIEPFQLMSWYPQFDDENKLLTFNRELLPRSDQILCLDPSLDEDWFSPMPNLFEAVRDTNLPFTVLEILDMVRVVERV